MTNEYEPEPDKQRSGDYAFFSYWLRYENGELYWRRSPIQRIRAGARAGSKGTHRHVYVGVRNKQYPARKIVWLLHYKKWPARDIEHIDKNTLNNKIENLRMFVDSDTYVYTDRPNRQMLVYK